MVVTNNSKEKSTDMNLEPTSPELSQFLEINSLFNHMKEKTCWKSETGRCIDLIISNKKYSLINSGTVETGLSDHHLSLSPKIVKYRNWKRFDNYSFKNALSVELNNISDYSKFEQIFNEILEKYAPSKTKVLRGNNRPYLTKDLRKAIMKRSKSKRTANISKKQYQIEHKLFNLTPLVLAM